LCTGGGLSIPSSAVGGDFPARQRPRTEKKEDILTLRTFFSAILLVIKTREKKNLLFNPFRLLAAQKNFVTFVVLVVTDAAETSDGDEADVEFIGAAWFTCFSEIE
jgi:hypothetical protein